jgi:CBS domain-containing protein
MSNTLPADIEIRNSGNTLSIYDHYAHRMAERIAALGLDKVQVHPNVHPSLLWAFRKLQRNTKIIESSHGVYFDKEDIRIWNDSRKRIVYAATVQELEALSTLPNLIVTYSFSYNNAPSQCIHVTQEQAQQGMQLAHQLGWNVGFQTGCNIHVSHTIQDAICVFQDHGLSTPLVLQDETKRRNSMTRQVMLDLFSSSVVEDLQISEACCVYSTSTVRDAITLMRGNEYDQLPVVNGKRRLVGMVQLSMLTSVSPDVKVQQVMTKFTGQKMEIVTPLTLVRDLETFWKRGIECVVVTDDGGKFVLGVVTEMDVNRFLNGRA